MIHCVWQGERKDKCQTELWYGTDWNNEGVKWQKRAQLRNLKFPTTQIFNIIYVTCTKIWIIKKVKSLTYPLWILQLRGRNCHNSMSCATKHKSSSLVREVTLTCCVRASSSSFSLPPPHSQSSAVRASTASSRCRARLYWAWFSGRISIRRPTSRLVWTKGTRGHRSSLGSCSTDNQISYQQFSFEQGDINMYLMMSFY